MKDLEQLKKAARDDVSSRLHNWSKDPKFWEDDIERVLGGYINKAVSATLDEAVEVARNTVGKPGDSIDGLTFSDGWVRCREAAAQAILSLKEKE